jgi:Rha family phage regulatory protein
MRELETVINLVERDGDYFVSSKEVAERFEKTHFHVLRDIDKLKVPDNFRLSNFLQSAEKDSQGIDRPVVYMTRDGFSILAFGFQGQKALDWKIAFLEAFNKMGRYIAEQLPAMQERIRQLESEKSSFLLESPKKPHHLKNTVLVPVSVSTMFGPELEYHRVPKDSDRYSDLAYKEGELKRLASCANGMSKKIDRLAREIALMRRN